MINIFSILLVTVSISNAFNYTTNYNIKFTNWLSQFKINISGIIEFEYIFNNWLENDKLISYINSKNLTYTLGHNAFSGMNSKDFTNYLGYTINKNINNNEIISNEIISNEIIDNLPKIIDWREKGVVTNIKNQMNCGSCWAFSAIATVESAIAIKTGNLYELSEQQLVSCAGIKYGNFGCNGGMYTGAWSYLETTNPCTESSYPYTSGIFNNIYNTSDVQLSCNKKCDYINYKVSNYVIVKPNSNSNLLNALSIGPVSIAIEADTKTFQLYKSGIYTDYVGCNSNSKKNGINSEPNIDHAVVLVGYNMNEQYYILRNSWDTTWGENGYMYIKYGSEYGLYGICGVLYQPMYPIIR